MLVALINAGIVWPQFHVYRAKMSAKRTQNSAHHK